MSMESIDKSLSPEFDDSPEITTPETDKPMRPYIYGSAIEGVAYGDSSCPEDPPDEV